MSYAQRNNNNQKQQTTVSKTKQNNSTDAAKQRQLAEQRRREAAEREERERIEREEQERIEREKRNAVRWDNSQKALFFNEKTYKMVYVEGGNFIMGASQEQINARDDEKPAHTVSIRSFYIGSTEVTQALWKTVMKNNPSHNVGDNLPVESVSWDDCQVFIQKLNSITGAQFRLPTEAEWEYAARGGWKSKKTKYSGDDSIERIAWYKDNAQNHTHEVEELDPTPDLLGLLHVAKHQNELDIYDMSGNVWEWCSDWYGNYGSNLQANPKGPNTGTHKVLRGGSYCHEAERCRVSSRGGGTTESRVNCIGLRIVCTY